MSSAHPASGSLTYNLVDRGQFIVKTTLIGGCVGGTVAMATGGSIVQQLVVAAVTAILVSGGLYWALLAVADAVTDGTTRRQVQLRAVRTNDRADGQPPADETSAPATR